MSIDNNGGTDRHAPCVVGVSQALRPLRQASACKRVLVRVHRQRWFWQKAGFAQGARRKPASRKGPKMVYNGLKPVYSLQK
jgi:hypothetical protein